jgi:hypothetical protein
MIIAAILSGLIFGTVGFLAGAMMSTAEFSDELEDRQEVAIQKIIAARESPNVVNIEDYRRDHPAPSARLSPGSVALRQMVTMETWHE